MMKCANGLIDDSNFGKPVPIIGLYISGATLLCIIAMVIDLVKGIKSKQFWIPAKYFSIDAASITIIGIAIKLSVDLNTPMPSQVDQLAKLATSAFICTVLVNIIPSMGKLKQGELLANKIALAILIIASIVNLCMQLQTGVIHEFRRAHILMIVMMSLFLYMCHSLTAEFVSSERNFFASQFEKLHQQALEELRGDSNENEKESVKIKEYLMKFSLMAQSGCPQLRLIRSPRSMALAQYNLIPALALVFVLFASITHNDKTVDIDTCSGKSDYGWSVLVILITQGIAVVLGLVTPFCRMIYAWKATSHKVRGTSPWRKKESLPVEKDFWMKHAHKRERLVIFPYIEHKYRSPTVYFMKMILYKLIIILQFCFLHCYPFLPPLSVTFTNREPNDYGPYFLHMSYQKNYLAYMLISSSRVTHKCFLDGKKKEPKLLLASLGNYLSHDFGGVLSFESDQVPPLSERYPPNCWALPVLTLTCIATALPNIDPASKEQLRMCVNEGLVYVKLVEDNLNATDDLYNIRYAAYNLWKGLNRPKRRWLSVDLENLASNSRSPKVVLPLLAESAEKMFLDYMSSSDKPYRRKCLRTKGPNIARRNICPAVAAHSMYKICRTTLQDCQNEGSDDPSSHHIFEKLRKAIVDILGACFTNLRQSILLECKRSTMENRRETALHMLEVFGETQEIMDILEEKAMKIPLSDDKMAFIDEWRKYLTHQRDIV